MGRPTWHYIALQNPGKTTLWLNVHFTLCAHNSRSLTTYLTKAWALSPKTCCGGIPCPKGPQHKHRDLPLIHSVDVAILARSPSNWFRTAPRFVAHCSVVCWTCCMCSFEASLSRSNPYLSMYIPCICVSLPSISAVMVKASWIHGWTRALRTASFCHTASTCSFSASACCIFASH